MKILRNPPATHLFTPVKIAIVTGLSDPCHCRLSPCQWDLLQRLDVPEEWKIYQNFPFVGSETDANSPPATPQTTRERTSDYSAASSSNTLVSLVRASLANGCQFGESHFAHYRMAAAPHWNALRQSTEQLLLITGSCGLQLAYAGLDALSPKHAEVRILALGPVAFHRPNCSVTSIQGTHDYISRIFLRKADQKVKRLAHLEYWQNAEVREMIRRWLFNNISESSAREAISRSNK